MFFLPPFLPNDWDLAEFDEENNFIEFIRIDNDYLLVVSYNPTENPSNPYIIFSAQTKISADQMDYSQLNIDSMAKNPQEAIEKCIKVMHRINQKHNRTHPHSES